MALHDDDLARMLFGWLTIETSVGEVRLADLPGRGGQLRYARTVDEFRQLAPVVSPDAPLINAGHVHEADLLRRLVELNDGLTLEQVNPAEELDHLAPPPLGDRVAVQDLEDRANAILGDAAQVAVRDFSPASLTALFVADPEVLRHLDRRRAIEVAPPLWASLVADADSFRSRHLSSGDLAPRLCLNWRSPLVRQLAGLSDPALFRRTVQLIHLQAKLASHHPLGPNDRATLATAMSDLVTMSLGVTDADPSPSREQS